MRINILLTLAALLLVVCLAPVFGQTPVTQPTPTPESEPAPAADPANEEAAKKTGDDVATPKTEATPDTTQLSEEERAKQAYYRSLIATDYRLGPEDVISVTVFGQPIYSKAGITVPPDGRIGLPLIVEGIMVIGKTTLQIQDEVTKKLDEYIIDPKVTVTLDKAVSARYGVLGYVPAPGAKIMLRRMTVYDAIVESGGILSTGDKEKVVLLRFKDNGPPQPILINLKDYEKGKGPEMVYLVPGDTILVPKKGFSFKDIGTIMAIMAPIGTLRTIAPVPFLR